LKLELLQRTHDGNLKLAKGAVFPSLPSPVVKITEFQVTNTRENFGAVYESCCDIQVTGVVKQLHHHPDSDARSSPVGAFHVNDSRNPVCLLPINIVRVSSTDAAGADAVEGQFSFKIDAVPVTGGYISFRIIVRDSFTGLSGSSLWGCTFAFPVQPEVKEVKADSDNDEYLGDDDFEDEDEDEYTIKEPTAVEGPELVQEGTGGDVAVYCLALREQDGHLVDYSLTVPGQGKLKFVFRRVPDQDWSLAVWPDSELPALFTLRPTLDDSKGSPAEKGVTQGLAAHPELGALDPQNQFLYGLGQGLAFGGYDLIFSPEAIVVSGARLCQDGQGIAFDLAVRNERTGVETQLEPVRPPLGNDALSLLAEDSTPRLFSYFAELFRTSDPRAKDVDLCMLLGGYSGVGLEHITIADWREHFFNCLANALGPLFKKTVSLPSAQQGYQIGRATGDALRNMMYLNQNDDFENTQMSDFLIRLGQLPYFKKPGYGRAVMEEKADLIKRLSRSK
jgi:hypothetical protein